jgi:integrase
VAELADAPDSKSGSLRGVWVRFPPSASLALPLTKADLDFGRKRLSVSRRLYEGAVDAPNIRQVPLSPGLAQRLWLLLATADDDALVFPDADGEPLSRTHLYRVVRAGGERAGIEWPVGLHTFRHSCASIMFRRGVPKEAIRRLLGHHSWEFTAGTYLHLDDDDLPDGAVVGDLVASEVTTAGVTRGTSPRDRQSRSDAQSEGRRVPPVRATATNA